MLCSIQDLCEKDVINAKTGSRLGPVCDVEIDTTNGRLVSIIIFNRQRLISFGGREGDIKINWEDIEVIGHDTILVKPENIKEININDRKKIWNNLFR